jgi:hypothetical protein
LAWRYDRATGLPLSELASDRAATIPLSSSDVDRLYKSAEPMDDHACRRVHHREGLHVIDGLAEVRVGV